MASSTARFKVVLLGEGRVGKTSILLRYVRDEYNDRQQSTLQASYLDKRVSGPANKPVQLSIWDTAGQERFHALGPIYYRDADGALLVYDITDHESFTKVRKWVRELRSIVGNDIAIVIAGNKYDLAKNRAVQEADALAYAESVGAAHIYTSAKQNKGLDESFGELTTRMTTRRREQASSLSDIGPPVVGGKSGRGRGGKSALVIVDNEQGSKKKEGGCC
mmetsp:Transcript_37980/g.65534  ORF Transcript_37980/g.65534 Transcript_37980/m.65534 type:complete len:220 (+) Transcript_37980:97-756(+)|eukprot:CAMPEP_0205920396 /NCGR_PEP_ID=MMETSP1325-20131115/11118_1 /ASSEMBLY_ACC=CAM_ASM_000708 /TAXON_ID=236786 /ORGANISM="Florenciella sp., Strain RCC1007" /LENGTH=219 /DNA_ID=CAMNT_0053288081 /DNA_START=97 /DNA_END=756 /DNA_ORIENTATION=-